MAKIYLNKIMPSCKSHIKDYCSKCTFAGIHFIADNTKHWMERCFWAVLVILSWYGSALLIIAAWDAFIKSPISFGVETTYKDWNTKMPAVAVCEFSNTEQVYNVSDTIWTPKHLPDLDGVLKEIAFFRGEAYNIDEVCYIPQSPDQYCPLSNYSYYANLVRSPCPKLLRNCTYNGQSFDCCGYFQPLDTDLGVCFMINSIQTKYPNLYPMISNITQKQGVLRFEVTSNVMVYTLGEEEIPGVTTIHSSMLKISLGKIYRRQVLVKNIENDPRVGETTPEQRACRFRSENEAGLYPHYSYSACNILCRKRAQMEICQCNDHFMPNTTESERCNITGMHCLHANYRQLTALKPSWSKRLGLVCDCMPSCDETEITVIKDVVISLGKKKKMSYVEILQPYLPTERFKRNVVRSRLDLVVSIGSTAGLFVGASLLSFVELIFFFTVRYINDIWMFKRTQKYR